MKFMMLKTTSQIEKRTSFVKSTINSDKLRSETNLDKNEKLDWIQKKIFNVTKTSSKRTDFTPRSPVWMSSQIEPINLEILGPSRIVESVEERCFRTVLNRNEITRRSETNTFFNNFNNYRKSIGFCFRKTFLRIHSFSLLQDRPKISLCQLFDSSGRSLNWTEFRYSSRFQINVFISNKKQRNFLETTFWTFGIFLWKF